MCMHQFLYIKVYVSIAHCHYIWNTIPFVSHQSHTSHSNTASHSNSKYSAEGDVKYAAPAASKVPSITTPVVKTTQDMFKLPDVNENIEMPNGTPTSGIMASMEMPASSSNTKLDIGDVNVPSGTDKIQ